MPIYEYQCEKCGVVTDIKHGFKETNESSCPQCGGGLKRLFNPAGIVFKGSGFYITDSRKGGDSSKSDSPKSESPKSESASGNSSPSSTPSPKSESAA